MCMGFGCNACGVTGCRIIDSPRERLIAILTNSFAPCNGRFPLLIFLCSVFFAGIFAGGVLFSVGGLASEGSPSALYATCVAAAVVCAWMQIRVNYQIYPFEPVIETGLDDETRAHLEYEGQRKTLWQQKRAIACERYGLSPREREILQILLKGRDAKYITDTFYISQSTAKTHIYNIYRKFGVHSRQELLDFIEGIDLVDEEPDATDETTS